MNSLEEVPFKILMGSQEDPLGEITLITAPELNIPDYLQILQDTEYEFTLENWVLTGLQVGYSRDPRRPALLPGCAGTPPSCPPYWLMFSSPQERRRSGELWEPRLQPRSLSLGAADSRRHLPRSVKFILTDSERDAGGYSEDDEGSSTEGERPRSSGPKKRPFSRLRDAQHGSFPRHSSPPSPRRAAQDPAPAPGQPRLGSPQAHSQRPSRERMSSSSKRKSFTHPRPPPSASSTPPQRRPSSAGPLTSSRNHNPSVPPLRPKTSHGRSSLPEASVELLSALSQDERELLETITEQGYPLHTAIAALQRTGRRSPHQILRYLMACDRLCDLGFDQTQVEEALEMFQYCESKAAEFLHLLAQFNEMGFQQSAIKEVLLVHENHRERALEELMMRVA